MSPEQIFGDGEVDARSDVWSMGVVLYECLAGVRPTQAESVGQIIRIIANDAIVPLEQRKPELPQDVTDIVKRTLSFDNTARPTIPELRAVVAEHAASAARLVVTTSVPPATGFEETEEERRKARRGVPVMLVAAAIAATGFALVGWREASRASPSVASSGGPSLKALTIADLATTATITPVETATATPSATTSDDHLVAARASTEPPTKTATIRVPSRTTTVSSSTSASPAASTPAPTRAPPADPASYQ